MCLIFSCRTRFNYVVFFFFFLGGAHLSSCFCDFAFVSLFLYIYCFSNSNASLRIVDFAFKEVMCFLTPDVMRLLIRTTMIMIFIESEEKHPFL